MTSAISSFARTAESIPLIGPLLSASRKADPVANVLDQDPFDTPAAPAPEPAAALAPDTGAASSDILGQAASKSASVPANDAAPRVDQPVGPNQRAAAAGVVRSANQADQLGLVAPKKRSASRAILG